MFGRIGRMESVEERYQGKMTQEGIRLMKAMLEVDPKKRITIREVIQSQYFDGLNEEFVEKKVE